MTETINESKWTLRKVAFKVFKAVLKSTILYAAYLLILLILTPVSQLVPGLESMLETFVTIYIVLIVLGELTSDTIFQYFLNAVKALFMIGYTIFTLQGGIFGVTLENVSLMIDLRLFMVIAIILGLLGLAKTMLQAVNYMNERSEPRLL